MVAESSYYSKYALENAALTDLNPIVMLVVHEPLDYDSVHVRMKLKALLADAHRIDGIKSGFSLNWLASFSNQKIRYRSDVRNLYAKLRNFPHYLNDVIVKKCHMFNKYDTCC